MSYVAIMKIKDIVNELNKYGLKEHSYSNTFKCEVATCVNYLTNKINVVSNNKT